jgi:hypothetical protein
MALVDIDNKLKKMVEAQVKKNPVAFPSIKNFCDKAIKLQLERLNKKK